MSELLQLAILVVGAVVLFYLFALRNEVRRMRDVLEGLTPKRFGFTHGLRLHASSRIIQMSSHQTLQCPWTYAIWTWRGAEWELEMGTVPPGHEPGGPPPFQGAFRGQRVKTECIPC